MSRINISPEIRAMAAKAMAEIEPQFKKIDEIAEINNLHNIFGNFCKFLYIK